MLIAAASDLPVLKCLIQFLQNRRLVNYCFLFVIACRFFQLFKNFFTKKPFNQISKLNKLFKKNPNPLLNFSKNDVELHHLRVLRHLPVASLPSDFQPPMKNLPRSLIKILVTTSLDLT